MNKYDVTVIGGGPGGLASAYSAISNGAKTLLLERENKLGGILKQCIHDGFGVTRFNEKLSGPEYAFREIEKLKSTDCDVSLESFVTNIIKEEDGFIIEFSTSKGMNRIFTKKIILATGCRERSSRGVFIAGTNPSGVMNAGQAQYYMNIMGKMPIKKAVILGSGDIGLIMARRITLEGGKVLGVYEVKKTPSGLSRNIAQCLDDFDIPLHLMMTVTRVFGKDRLEAVEVARVDEKMNVIKGTEEIIKCDALILSVGLIPENELSTKLEIPLSKFTKGPTCDQTFMTLVDGVYTCGNAMHVNDLADFVSESGEIAGKNAANYKKTEKDYRKVNISKDFGYVVPQMIDFNKDTKNVIFYFRVRDNMENKTLLIKQNDEVIFKKKFRFLKPPEMEKIVLNLDKKEDINFTLED